MLFFYSKTLKYPYLSSISYLQQKKPVQIDFFLKSDPNRLTVDLSSH